MANPFARSALMGSRRTRALVALGALGLVAAAGLEAQAPARSRAVTPHAQPFDDSHMLRWPLPAGQEAYGQISGDRIKRWVDEIAAISRKSRDDGERYWGRISGTKYDHMTEQWVEDRFRQFGLANVRRQWFDLPPQWFPVSWRVAASSGDRRLEFASARPVTRSPATPAGGLDLEPVWVGLGTEADFAGAAEGRRGRTRRACDPGQRRNPVERGERRAGV
jgi:hypothetical protein